VANENKVAIEITVDAKDAQAAIELFGQNAVKSVKKAEDSTRKFGESFKESLAPIAELAAQIGLAVGAYELLSKSIEGATKDQKLFLQIGDALSITGENTDAATKKIVEFADELKRTTGVSDDLAKQIFIDGKAFGITTEEAKKLTKAAIDYAAATGIDVETATRRLGQTLDGQIGRIGKLGDEFRNLTEDQLKNGEAIDLIANRYKGAAVNQFDTFEGATNSLKNAVEDLLKSFGKVVIQSQVVSDSIKGVAEATNSVAESVDSAGKKTNLLDDLFQAFAATGGGLAQNSVEVSLALEDQRKNMENLIATGLSLENSSKKVSDGFAGIVELADGLKQSTNEAKNFEDRIKSLSANIVVSTELTGKRLEKFLEDRRKAQEELSKFLTQLSIETADEIEKVRIKAELDIKKLDDLAVKSGQEGSKKIADAKLAITTKLIKDIEKINQDADDREQERIKKQNDELNHLLDLRKERLQKERDDVQKSASDPFSALANGVNTSSGGQLAGVAVGITSSILQGAQGATKAVAQTLGALADSIIPGIGGAVAGLAELLARGPEATKQSIREFVKAVPDVIIAIAESIPVVVEVFVDSMINRGGAVRIGVAIAKAMLFVPVWERIGQEISNGFKQLDFTGARDAIIEGLSTFREAALQFANTIGESLRNFFSGLFQPLEDAIRPLTNAVNGLLQPIADLIAALKGGKGGGSGLINEALGGKGGGSGVIAETFGRIGNGNGGLKFSKGGVVPKYAAMGFQPKGVDVVPAMVQPGELIVSKDTNTQLADFLSKNSGGSDQATLAMLAQILATVSQPVVVKTEAKVNQSAFADIIVQLNRQNARLSA